MEASITTNMNEGENAKDSRKHLYTAPSFKSGIFKTYWLLLMIIYISLVHRKPMNPMNAKNIKVITRVGASTKGMLNEAICSGRLSISCSRATLPAGGETGHGTWSKLTQSHIISHHPGCVPNEWSTQEAHAR